MGILIDLWEMENNVPLEFLRVQSSLADRGVGLSRSRWSYLVRGTGSLVNDGALLSAVADFFSVPDEYLCDLTGPTPVGIEEQMEALRELRIGRLKEYAQRQLALTDPETLEAILKAINA